MSPYCPVFPRRPFPGPARNARGATATATGVTGAVSLAVALLFFLYGARLSAREALAGAGHWRLHLLVLGCTFGLFPLLGEATRLLPDAVLPPQLSTGVLFLTLLPSTVQSSIAFTSVAGGNVAAAICAATFPSLLGVVLTPLLRRRVGLWTARHRPVTALVDLSSILLIVYSAFGEGVREGVRSRVTPAQLLRPAVISPALLATVLGFTRLASGRLGFSRADGITVRFCGSKKSLANGLPLATVLFPAPAVGSAVLPLMLFHQLRLMVCTVLAQRWSRGATLPG
ncbi:bile acid:sodium symporter family protein [Kitasatospora phosalacinea]|uniref:Bile acid:sodium symporter family protein n=1 Tax=Kitasatospora phosalacinea TaxID=2065 RepID=A0ABW6GCQ6_9ACTN